MNALGMRGARASVWAATVAALSLVTSNASAWTPISGSRPVWCSSVPYGMHQAGSDDLGADMTETIVRQGMDDWSRVSCTSLTTTYNGRTSTRASTRGQDGNSLIGWIESGWPHDSNAIGVTGPRWSRCIAEADMEMNGENYAWTASSGRGSSVNAYSIVLHEGGHYYGLGHSEQRDATMYFAYSGGVDMLTADDQEGICTLYPGDGTPEDCSVTGCPSGEQCVGGRCVRMTGDGDVCAPCDDSSECGGENDFCLAYPDGNGYCGRECFGGDCPAGSACADLGGVGQCIGIDSSRNITCSRSTEPGCTNDTDCTATERCDTSTGSCVPRPTDGAGLGEPCEAGDDCNSGLCVPTPSGSVCSETCNWLDPSSCPSGFYCNGSATGACGDGVCLAGSAGTIALGEACTQNIDCATLFCASGTCSTPCVPDGAAGCSDGFVCQVGSTSRCGACKRAGELGAACSTSEDCASLYCACRSGGTCWCTDLCDADTPCPDAFTCEGVGTDVSVCVPRDGVTPGPTRLGDFGEPCATDAECVSGACGCVGSACSCTRECDATRVCPPGYLCPSAADGGASTCRLSSPSSGGSRSDDGGCGCRVAPTRESNAGRIPGIAVVGIVLLLRRRRRRRLPRLSR